MSFEDNIMRRVQWARFMNKPIVLTQNETLKLLYGYVSDSNYDQAWDEPSYWHCNNNINDWDGFIPPENYWGNHFYVFKDECRTNHPRWFWEPSPAYLQQERERWNNEPIQLCIGTF